MNISELEEILKNASRSGELNLEFLDEDIEFLLAHSEKVLPSENPLAEMEQILLKAIEKRQQVKTVGSTQLAEVVMEKSPPYEISAVASAADSSLCTVGEALNEELRVSGLTEKQAAEKLRISERIVESLLKERTSFTRRNARRVAGLLSTRYRLSIEAEELLCQWLLNGLQYRKMRHTPNKVGVMRAAARKKKQ